MLMIYCSPSTKELHPPWAQDHQIIRSVVLPPGPPLADRCSRLTEAVPPAAFRAVNSSLAVLQHPLRGLPIEGHFVQVLVLLCTSCTPSTHSGRLPAGMVMRVTSTDWSCAASSEGFRPLGHSMDGRPCGTRNVFATSALARMHPVFTRSPPKLMGHPSQDAPLCSRQSSAAAEASAGIMKVLVLGVS